MLFIVHFTDKPGSLALGQELLPAHLRCLEQHRDAVLVAGSLRPELDAVPVGACWIVEADSKPAVEALLRTDPFWIKGLRAGHEVCHWSKAFPERTVQV